MRKKKVPHKTEKRKRSHYNHEVFLAAWKAVENGMSAYTACKVFGVPKQTLADRKSGRVRDPLKIGAGETPVFGEDQERKITDHIQYMSLLGYYYSRAEMITLATDNAHFLSLLPLDKGLTCGWCCRFLARWPELKSLRPKGADMHKARCATPEAMKYYFSELKNLMEKYNLIDKPHCIYYVDEIGINCEYSPGEVFCMRNRKIVDVGNMRLPTTTVIACGNAAGNFVPPFIIFKGKKKSPDFLRNCSDGATISMSATGWSNNNLLMDFIQDHFLKHSMGSDSDYKLLLYDGHAMHINISMIEWAKERKVIIFVLPPRTSFSNPVPNVECYSLFKRFLLKRKQTETITKSNLAEIICEVYPKAFSHQNLVLSFRNSGIYPLNAQMIEKN